MLATLCGCNATRLPNDQRLPGIGWLFTIGYAKLSFMQGVYAVVLWPWYLGATLG